MVLLIGLNKFELYHPIWLFHWHKQNITRIKRTKLVERVIKKIYFTKVQFTFLIIKRFNISRLVLMACQPVRGYLILRG